MPYVCTIFPQKFQTDFTVEYKLKPELRWNITVVRAVHHWRHFISNSRHDLLPVQFDQDKNASHATQGLPRAGLAQRRISTAHDSDCDRGLAPARFPRPVCRHPGQSAQGRLGQLDQLGHLGEFEECI